MRTVSLFAAAIALWGATNRCFSAPLTPSGADDYSAISDAITAAGEGGTVELGAGIFRMSGTLTLDKAVTLKGAGKSATFLNGTINTTGRGLHLTSASAVVRDLTVTGYTNANDAAGVYLSAGTITNAAVTWCTATEHSGNKGGGVYMTGGTVADCDILHNRCVDGYNYRWGGGVYMTGGTIVNCRIVGNTASINPKNAGLCLNGNKAVARNCYIAENKGNNVSDGADGVVIFNGTLENSVVCSNGVGGVWMSGGTMRNTLVFGHRHTSAFFAGVRNGGGTIQNCTIADNATTSDSSGLSGLYQTKGTTVNTIVYGNGPDGSAAGSVDVSAGKFLTNVTDKAVAIGVDCYVTNPKFRDAASRDFHLALGSPAIGRAATLAAVTNDLDGVTRNADGKGADIGCYEYVPSAGGDLACAVSVDGTEYLVGASVTVKATAEGGDGNYSYAWYLDGSETAVQTGTDATYLWTNPSAGYHAVKVVVTDGASHSKSAEEERFFKVRPLEVYVSTTGGDEYPYHTADKAAHTIGDALAAVWQSSSTTATVHVAEGTYPISSTMTFSMPMRLLGAGADKTLIDSKNNPGRIVTIKHRDVEVRGFTLANADANVSAAGVSMSDGIVADCVITNCLGYTMDGGGVIQSGGLITNCVITKCEAKRTGSGYSHGDGLYQSGGRVIDCLFRANYAAGEWFNGLSAHTAGGTIERCVFTGHNGSTKGEAGTSVQVAGGSLINCLIYGNTCNLGYGDKYKRTAGVVMTSGKVIHCTIAGNSTTGSCLAAPGLVIEGGTALNNVIYGNTSSSGAAGVSVKGTSTVNTNLVDFALGSGIGNINGDPKFCDAAANDFHLGLGSGARDAGSAIAGAEYDLDGVLRNGDGKGADLGCYEYVASSGGPLVCSFTPDKKDILYGDTVTVTASVEGGTGTGYVYRWYLNGASTPVLEGADEDTLVLDNLDYGKVSIRLVVEDSAGTTKDAEEADVIAVRSTVAYADATGSNTFPYETKAKAAHDVNDAYDALWTTAEETPVLYVGEGTYPQTKAFSLSRSFRIVGAGADKTTLDAAGTTIRSLRLNHDDAVVRGLTVANAKADLTGGGAYVSKGLLTDCVITNCTGYCMEGGGVRQDGGVISNTVITRCSIVRSSSGYNRGEGLYQTAGLAFGCTFSGNYYGYTVVNSIMHANGIGAHTIGGTIANSVFTGHASTPVMVEGGNLVNCLVYGNSCSTIDSSDNRQAAGVVLTSGKVIHCTVAGNAAKDKCLTASGLVAYGGTALNNIVYGNTSESGAAGVTVSGSATVNTNLVDFALVNGVGNINGDPKFRDAAANNFHLGLGSSARDAGSMIEGVEYDMDGVLRNEDGKGADLGCYEYVVSAGGPLVCGFTPDKKEILHGDTVTVTASAEGGSGTGYVYSWYLDDDASPRLQGEGKDTFVLEDLDYGRHSIRLVVEDSAGATKEVSETDVIAVKSTVAYADATGSNTFPYETKAKAAHDVNDAYDAVWKTGDEMSVLHIGEGTFPQTRAFVLERSFQIIGAGADKTTLDAKETTIRSLRLNHDDAVVRGLTVANAKADLTGGGAYVSKGLLTDCVITNCTGYCMEGGGVRQDGGVISNTVITRCSIVRSGQAYTKGEGLYQTAGLASNCRFVANASSGIYANGIGAHIEGSGTIANSVFTGHASTPVMVAGGTLRNCLVFSNSCSTADNSSYRKTAGIMQTGGKVVNCTVAANAATGKCEASPGLVAEAGRAVNNIFWGNTSASGAAGVTVSGSALVDNNIVDCDLAANQNADPKFRRLERGDFRLREISPAIDCGNGDAWNGAPLAEALDLRGNPRLRREALDLGCYEWQPTGLMLLVR